MIFKIQAEPDGGFSVLWDGPPPIGNICTIQGFATSIAAQEFIQGIMVKMAIAFAPKKVS